jgi:hypothetical protein
MRLTVMIIAVVIDLAEELNEWVKSDDNVLDG